VALLTEFAADEFFKASISNPHTRRAYGRIVSRFLVWCDERGLALHHITPGLAGEYMAGIDGSPPTKNQALAALRNFFDALVNRHAVPLNSFATVRGVKHSVTEGRTAEISIEQARKLFRSIDTSTPMGLRDRAILGVLAYTGARVGAVMSTLFGRRVEVSAGSERIAGLAEDLDPDGALRLRGDDGVVRRIVAGEIA